MFGTKKSKVEGYYKSVRGSLNRGDISPEILRDLDDLFSIALGNDLFPGKFEIDQIEGRTGQRPSQRKASPKGSCDDPAIGELVSNYLSALFHKEFSISDLQRVHNLFMSAENKLGELLEEYIAEKIEPLGFIWCVNATLRSIDFCDRKGKLLIQVKNKDNTENSSSSSVRKGTPILKWNRLKTVRRDGKPVPAFNWEELNGIIGQYISKRCNLSEEGFQDFLRNAFVQNPKIITQQ